MSDAEVVKEVLGEDWFEMFSDTVSSYHSDIVSDLNEKNMLELKNIILRDLENSELDSDHFGGLFFQNNTDENGNVQINNENINYVLSVFGNNFYKFFIIFGCIKSFHSFN